MTNPRLLLVDGHSLARRMWESSQAAVGPFLGALLNLRRDWKPQGVTVAWDSPQSHLLRQVAWSEYKAGRKSAGPVFEEELGHLRDVLPLLGVLQVIGETGEADDVIARISREAPGPVLIYSADKDLLQLLRPGVAMLRAGRGGVDMLIKHDTLAKAEIKCGGATITGLDAKGWLDFQTLAGDSTDHIPGLKGIGAKKARALLEACPRAADLLLAGEFDTVREDVAAADASLARALERAIKDIDRLRITRQLVALHNVPLCFTAPATDLHAARVWLVERGFHGLAERVGA